MDRVKKEIHYLCDAVKSGACTGENIGVAILDTGLAPHPDFRGRVMAFKDCIYGRGIPYDDSGHGTHVAGILAGDGQMSGGILSGIAPKAKLAVVKVLDKNGNGDVRQILKGIDWVEKNHRKYNIRIVNISAGSKKGLEKEKEVLLIEAVEHLWDIGLVVVTAAGNEGPGKGTVTVPGTSRKIITVGAVKNERELGVSGQGPTEGCIIKPDVLAPGYQIISCNTITGRKVRPYTVKSGTSMAAPVVSGAFALLLEKYPQMSNVEVKLRLRETCRRLPGLEESGWGMLQVDRLLEEK